VPVEAAEKRAPKILTRAIVLALRWKICDIGPVGESREASGHLFSAGIEIAIV
jgi:hypothetical protein